MEQRMISPAPAAILMIALGAALRLIPHPANVAPIAALALFGGAHLPLRYGLVIPLLGMALSDFVIGFDVSSLPYTYGVFALIAVIGRWVGERPGVMKLLAGSLAGSLGFFLVTNLVWIYPESLYPYTLAGQIESYTMALPFFRNTLLGDLGYTAGFFGIYALCRNVAMTYLPPRLAARYF